MDIFEVRLTKIEKSLKKIPMHIVLKLHGWVDYVADNGLRAAMKIKGYHDELFCMAIVKGNARYD
jgi:hypothetical protein